MKHSLRKSLLVLFGAMLLAVASFAADDPGDPNIFHHKDKKEDKDKDKKTPKQMVSSSVRASETPIPRIWIGLTGSLTPLKLLHASSTGLVNTTTGESLLSTVAGGFYGGGLTLNARILKNYWVNVGAIYRFVGYDWTYSTNDANLDVLTERSRARLIDFPVMVRYTGSKFNPTHKYTFFELGGAFRDAIARKTTTNLSDYLYQSLGTGVASNTAYHRETFGAMAGAGLIAKDDFGIIVSPEIRYTRWMGETFGSNTLSTQRNQLEITISFGF